ncbi:hypothetical protein [Acidocella facilis]|uniref:hypothetical protein n=1 Tax=Acidocella facilis TaxID=525 RepID=UPI00047CCC74|nr:hypothetical protein [Acidocella facilis]
MAKSMTCFDDSRVIALSDLAYRVLHRLVLRLEKEGAAKFFDDAEGVAARCGLRLSQLHAAIAELDEAGLIVVDTQSLAVPALDKKAARARTARENGAKGGRPRRNVRPQLEVIEGGRCDEAEMKGDDDIDKAWRHIVPLAAKWAGLASPVGSPVVREWLVAGADQAMIKSVICEKTSSSVYSLKFFDTAMKRALKEKNKPQKPLWEKKYDEDYRLFELTGRGEPPRVADYRARYGDGANGVRGTG